MDDLHFDRTIRCLICKIHRHGVHPTSQAIVRHLRGAGHDPANTSRPKQIADELLKHPVATTEELLETHTSTSISSPASQIPRLQVYHGFACTGKGCGFLTTSLELINRHTRKCLSVRRPDSRAHEECHLQTIFQETKYRRYFIVSGIGPSEDGSRDIPRQSDTSQGLQSPRQSSPSRTNLYRSNSPLPTLAYIHPLAELARGSIDYLDTQKLDRLFKSSAFRLACSPLFDTSHIDAQRGMAAVFPGFQEEPAFLHALTFSLLQLAGDQGDGSVTSVTAKSKSIYVINERLASSPTAITPALLGAIMLLKTAAWKTKNQSCHDIHANGMTILLQACGDNILTDNVKRALFWQDVYAPVFVDAPRAIAWRGSTNLVWHEENYPVPRGLARLQNDLPPDLNHCIVNTLELQSRRQNIPLPSQGGEQELLESMRASIVSRLVDLGPTCTQSGIHVEAIRLSVFLCSRCPWNDDFLRCEISATLMTLTETTLIGPEAGSVWVGKWDLLLWVLMLASSAVETDQGHVRNLRLQRRRVLALATIAVEQCPPDVALEALGSALHDFVYRDGWMEIRGRISDWSSLEDSVTRRANE